MPQSHKGIDKPYRNTNTLLAINSGCLTKCMRLVVIQKKLAVDKEKKMGGNQNYIKIFEIYIVQFYLKKLPTEASG